MNPNLMQKTALSPAALTRRALGRAFARNQRGAVAVEFALLALPFFAIIGAILETAFFFLASQVLDSAVDTSVRLLRTGQAQEVNYTAANFRTKICESLFNLFDCSQLQIDVDTSSSFSSSVSNTYPLILDPATDITTWKADINTYKPGNGSDIVTVRVYYKWPTILDIMGFNLSNAGTGYRLMASVRVFQNEPFTAGGSS